MDEEKCKNCTLFVSEWCLEKKQKVKPEDHCCDKFVLLAGKSEID